MIEAILAIILAILVAVVIYYVLKKAITLLINSLVGIITLFLLNFLGVMSWFGKPAIPINLVTVLICAFGGLPGALIVFILHLAGVAL